mmetsp:Transcript_51914/g.110937  ORF Transcript_51914/g.110937 Transcript_51914/m.110937 type:complete len:448 (-) Transcript_51914:68-1411(-)
MSITLDLTVVIDQASGFVIQKSVIKGSTIGELKQALAGDDPTGGTRPEDLVLASGSTEHASPLRDDVPLDETLLTLVVATPAEVPGQSLDAIAAAGDDPARSTAMKHVLARTNPAELPSLSVAREVYNIINCADENDLNYDDFEEYAVALEQYWTDAIMDEDAGETILEDQPGPCFDEGKYHEGRLFKARGDLLERQQQELLCMQYMKMLQETMDYPWLAGEGVIKPDREDDFEPIDIREDGVPVRKAMKTGYVDSLVGGMASDLEKYVDIRKIWCLSEKAAHIGQARKELIESVLTAHAMDVKAGGKGVLIEKHRLGRAAPGAISLEDIRKELDSAFEAKLIECTEALPVLREEVEKAQKVCDDRQRDIDRIRREREQQINTKREAADAEAQAKYDRELAEWREECRQADLREEEERKQKEAAAEATRKSIHDAARRRCLLEKYGQ